MEAATRTAKVEAFSSWSARRTSVLRKISSARGLRQAIASRVCTGKSKRPVTVPSEADKSVLNRASASAFNTAGERPRDGGSSAARSATADSSRAIGTTDPAFPGTRASPRRIAGACHKCPATASSVASSAIATASRPRYQSRPSAMVEISDVRTGSPQPIVCAATASVGRRPERRSPKRAMSLPLYRLRRKSAGSGLARIRPRLTLA